MKNIILALPITALLFACGPSAKSNEDKRGEASPKAMIEQPLLDGAKMARCEIKPNRYSGPCMFLAEKNGSFSVQMRDRSPLYPDVTVISVSITQRGKAQVFGLTTFGNNSRWGEATRSASDPACWVGVDFEVCAY